jgi:signal peptidase II
LCEPVLWGYGYRMSHRWKVLAAIGVVVLLADQWSKFLAVKHLTSGIADAHFDTEPFASGARARPRGAARVAEVQGLSLGAELTYFYFDVKHPCRRASARCPTRHVMSGAWAWRYVENPGAAWGLLSTVSDSVRVPFFYLVSFAAIGFILNWVRRLEPGQTLVLIGFSLVLGGALGNFADRLHLNYVIDFIDWYVIYDGRPLHWPTFNVADAAISTGVGMLMLDMFLTRENTDAAEQPGPG